MGCFESDRREVRGLGIWEEPSSCLNAVCERCLCFWDGGTIVVSGCSAGENMWIVPKLSKYAGNRNVAVALIDVGNLCSNR